MGSVSQGGAQMALAEFCDIILRARRKSLHFECQTRSEEVTPSMLSSMSFLKSNK